MEDAAATLLLGTLLETSMLTGSSQQLAEPRETKTQRERASLLFFTRPLKSVWNECAHLNQGRITKLQRSFVCRRYFWWRRRCRKESGGAIKKKNQGLSLSLRHKRVKQFLFFFFSSSEGRVNVWGRQRHEVLKKLCCFVIMMDDAGWACNVIVLLVCRRVEQGNRRRGRSEMNAHDSNWWRDSRGTGTN